MGNPTRFGFLRNPSRKPLSKTQLFGIQNERLRREADVLLAKKLNRNVRNYRKSDRTPKFFDELFSSIIAEELPHTLTKPAIMGRRTAARTEFYEINLSPGKTEHAQKAAKYMLKKYGAFYFKGEPTVGVGAGLIRVDLAPTRLTLTIPSDLFRTEILRTLDRLHGSDDFIWYTGEQRSREIGIPFKVMNFGEQPLEKVLGVLFEKVIPKGHCLIEKPMNIPKYNGKTWEIRHIVQLPDGKPQVTAKYVKVGGDDKFANIFLGGSPEKAEKVVETVFQENSKSKTSAWFLKQSEAIAIEEAQRLSQSMRGSLFHTHAVLRKFNSRHFYPRRLAVDITADMLHDGRLVPRVVETQYPIGYKSYVPELEEVDKQALERIHEVDQKMENDDREIIRNFLYS